MRSPGSSADSRSGVLRQAMQFVECDLATAVPAFDLDDRVERDQRHAEVGRMRGDAALAPAKHGVHPVLAVPGVAAAADLALVAAAGGIVEIRTPRPLQQVAAYGRRIAQLRRRAGEKRLCHGRIRLRKLGVMREIGIADQRTDPQRAIGEMLDPIEPVEMRNIDEPIRTADIALHQIEQVGAGGEIGRARLGGGGNGFSDRGGPDIIELFHAERLWLDSSAPACASSTASTMPA